MEDKLTYKSRQKQRFLQQIMITSSLYFPPFISFLDGGGVSTSRDENGMNTKIKLWELGWFFVLELQLPDVWDRHTYIHVHKKVSFQIYITFLLLKLILLVWGNPKFRGLNKITFYLFLPCGCIRVCSGNGKGSLEQHLLAANPQIYCWKTPPFTLFHPTEEQTRRSRDL